jgi:hypothetical protein
LFHVKQGADLDPELVGKELAARVGLETAGERAG